MCALNLFSIIVYILSTQALNCFACKISRITYNLCECFHIKVFKCAIYLQDVHRDDDTDACV